MEATEGVSVFGADESISSTTRLADFSKPDKPSQLPTQLRLRRYLAILLQL